MRRPLKEAGLPEFQVSQVVLDVLEIPQRARRAGTYRRLAKLMTGLVNRC
jgi:hypothetical protein